MGPSSAEKSAAQQTQATANQMVGQATQIFGNDNAVFNQMKSAYQTIINGGPGQQGFSQAELNARTSAAVTADAAAFRNASASVKSGLAGVGGGNQVAAAGAAISPMLDLANKEAAKESGDINQIQQENYATGRENFFKTSELNQQLPSQAFSNVPGVEGATLGAEKQNSEEQQQLNAQAGWWKGPVLGLVNAGLSYASGGLSNLASGANWAGQKTTGTSNALSMAGESGGIATNQTALSNNDWIQ